MFKWLRRKRKMETLPLPTEKKSWINSAEAPGFNHYGAQAFRSFLEKMPKARAASIGKEVAALDALPGVKRGFANMGEAMLNDALLGWFVETSFIGYPLCAIIAQNWLVDKACSMPARDAVRHGFDVTFSGVEDSKQQALLQDEIKKANKNYDLQKHMQEFIRMGRIFGIRIAMFDLEMTDRDKFYENPFNPDALTPDTKYKGIVQIDQNWIAPVLDNNTIGDPSKASFYEPEWWQIGGRKIHKSHLVIFIPNPVADVLKPMYQYGGVSVPQRIFERVYAAERTANEGPQLAMSKRLTHWKTSMEDVLGNREKFRELLVAMQEYRDNFSIKISDTGDEVQQFETSLADLDTVIMTQYQIVAAIAHVPVTKLMGTTPKGFNSTGEFETKSYHEELETIQTNDLQPLVERHLLILARTNLAPLVKLPPEQLDASIDWAPVDSPSAKDYADINKIKAETDNILQMTGAIDGVDIRARISADPNSGYTDLPEPENEDDLNDGEENAATITPGQISQPDDPGEERA